MDMPSRDSIHELVAIAGRLAAAEKGERRRQLLAAAQLLRQAADPSLPLEARHALWCQGLAALRDRSAPAQLGELRHWQDREAAGERKA